MVLAFGTLVMVVVTTVRQRGLLQSRAQNVPSARPETGPTGRPEVRRVHSGSGAEDWPPTVADAFNDTADRAADSPPTDSAEKHRPIDIPPGDAPDVGQATLTEPATGERTHKRLRRLVPLAIACVIAVPAFRTVQSNSKAPALFDPGAVGFANLFFYSPQEEPTRGRPTIRITANGDRVSYGFSPGASESSRTLLELHGGARLELDDADRSIFEEWGVQIFEEGDLQSFLVPATYPRMELDQVIAGAPITRGRAGTAAVRIGVPSLSSGCYQDPIYSSNGRVVVARHRRPLFGFYPRHDFDLEWSTPECWPNEHAVTVVYESPHDEIVENPTEVPTGGFGSASTSWELDDSEGLTFLASSSDRAAAASQRILVAGLFLGVAGTIVIEELIRWSMPENATGARRRAARGGVRRQRSDAVHSGAARGV
jgi:hypothetical protein